MGIPSGSLGDSSERILGHEQIASETRAEKSSKKKKMKKSLEPSRALEITSSSASSSSSSTESELSTKNIQMQRGKGKGKSRVRRTERTKATTTSELTPQVTLREIKKPNVIVKRVVQISQPTIVSSSASSSSQVSGATLQPPSEKTLPFKPQEEDQIYAVLNNYHSSINYQAEVGPKVNTVLYLKQKNDESIQLNVIRQSVLESLGNEEVLKIYQSQTKRGDIERPGRTGEPPTRTSYNFDPLNIALFIIEERHDNLSYLERLFIKELVKELQNTDLSITDEFKAEILEKLTLPDKLPTEIYTPSDPNMVTTFEEIQRRIATNKPRGRVHAIRRLVSEARPAEPIAMHIEPEQHNTAIFDKDPIYGTLQYHYSLVTTEQKPVLYIKQTIGQPPMLATIPQARLKNDAGALNIYNDPDKIGTVDQKNPGGETTTVLYDFNPQTVANFILQNKRNLSFTERVMLRTLFAEIAKTPANGPNDQRDEILAQLAVPDASDVMAVIDGTYNGAQAGYNNCDIAFANSETKTLLVADGVGHDSPTVASYDHPFFKNMNEAMNTYIKQFDFSTLSTPEEFGRTFEKEFLDMWDTFYQNGPLGDKFTHHVEQQKTIGAIINKIMVGTMVTPQEWSTYMANISETKIQALITQEQNERKDDQGRWPTILNNARELERILQVLNDSPLESDKLEILRAAKESTTKSLEGFNLDAKEIEDILELVKVQRSKEKGEKLSLEEEGQIYQEIVQDFIQAEGCKMTLLESLAEGDQAKFQENDQILFQLSQKYRLAGIRTAVHNRTVLGERYNLPNRLVSKESGRGGPCVGIAIPFRTSDGRQHLYIQNYADVSALVIAPKHGEVIIDPDRCDPLTQIRIIQEDNDKRTYGETGTGFGCRPTRASPIGTTVPFPDGSAFFMYTDGAGEFVTQEEVTHVFLKTLYASPQEISDTLIEEVTRSEHQMTSPTDSEDSSRKRAAARNKNVKKFDPTGIVKGGLDDLAFAGIRTVNPHRFTP